MYGVNEVRDVLMRAAEGSRPDEEWLRAIEGASAIDGEDGTFGLSINGQEFFVMVAPA